jgi:hypothetical protein
MHILQKEISPHLRDNSLKVRVSCFVKIGMLVAICSFKFYLFIYFCDVAQLVIVCQYI